MCINCQSIQSTEKHSKFYVFLDYHKPEIVVGTESWLHKDIPYCEVFPSFLGYNPPIRRDRPGDTKGGGVFILVSQRLVVSEQPQLSTDWNTMGQSPSGRGKTTTYCCILSSLRTRPGKCRRIWKILGTDWHIKITCLGLGRFQLPKTKLGGKSARSQTKLSKPWNVSRFCFCSRWQLSHPNGIWTNTWEQHFRSFYYK